MQQSENVSFVQLLKRIAKEERESADCCNVLTGVVTKANPLEIKISPKITLTDDFLVLCRNVTNHNISVSLNIDTGSASIEHTHGVDITSQTGGSTNHSHTVNFDSQMGGKEAPDHKHGVSGSTSSVNISHTHEVTGATQSAGGSHSHKVNGTFTATVNNALKKGDKVLLVMANGGQVYYVIDKVVI